MQRNIKQIYFILHMTQIFIQCFFVIFPIFTHRIKLVSLVSSHCLQKIFDKQIINMLNGIQTHTIQIQFPGNPYSPVFHFLNYVRMVKIYIGTHQKIVIAIFTVHTFTPGFSFPYNLKYTLFFTGHIIIHPGKMIPMPFKSRITLSSPREIKSCPSFNLIRLGFCLFTLFRTDFPRHKFFSIISPGFMIHDSIQIHAYLIFV